MTAVWPSTLPSDLQVAGYSETWLDQWVETAMEDGFPPKRRLRFSGQMYEVDAVMTLDQNRNQLSTLKAFFQQTLGAGSLPFNFVLPSTGETVIMRFQSKLAFKGLGNKKFTCAFKVRVDPA